MARKQLVIPTYMTPGEWLVALVLIATGWAVIHGFWQETNDQRRARPEQRSAKDEQALWTLERIAGALELYCRDNGSFPYDSGGANQALGKIWAGEAEQRGVRVEYLNSPPDRKHAGETLVVLATRPASNQGGMAFFMTELGAIYQCREENIERLGLSALAGVTAETISRLGAANIDEANLP